MAYGDRKSERVDFDRGIPVCMMGIDGTWRRDCMMIDVSQTGARLLIEGYVVLPYAPPMSRPKISCNWLAICTCTNVLNRLSFRRARSFPTWLIAPSSHATHPAVRTANEINRLTVCSGALKKR